MGFDIPLFDVAFDEREAEAVAETVRSKWISMGQKVQSLEQEMQRRLGAEHVVAVSSCTGALHLAMVALGIGPGDEVIVPSMTFVATANAVKYVNATPVFADIFGPENPTLDPEDIRRKITPRTRAIVPVHYGGFPCDMEALCSLAREHGLKVVEDAAHTIDVPHGGQKLGTFGDVGCFSMFANKVVTAGEGGFVVTSDAEIGPRLRFLRSHGMTTVSWDRARGHATSYDVVDVGYNYRMDDIRASLALVQLAKLDGILERRAHLRRVFVNRLSSIPGLVVPFSGFEGASANYIMPVVLESGDAVRREAIRDRLKDAGIQTSVHYPAIHRFSAYDNGQEELLQTNAFADREITLPFFDALTEEQVDRVAGALQEALKDIG